MPTIGVHLVADMSAPVTETLGFATSIFTTSSGKEQRSAERIVPRRTLQFTVSLVSSEYQIFSAMLHDMDEGGAIKTVRIADVAREGVGLLSDHAQGATLIYTNGIPHWAVVGATVAIATATATVFGMISAVNTGLKRLTLASGLPVAIAAGATVRPSITGNLSFQNELAALTDEVLVTSVKFRQTIGEVPSPFVAPTLASFDGRSVLITPPNWEGGISSTLILDAASNDYERGPVRDFLKNDAVQRTLSFSYFGRASEDMGQIASLFSSMRGRQGEFWCPSWANEMTSVDGIAAGSSTINVKGRVFADVYANSKVNKAIAIRLSDDTWLFRKITAITVNGANPGQFSADYSSAFSTGESVVTVDQPWAQSAFADEDFSQLVTSEPIVAGASRLEVVAIYWLYLARMANDTLTVNWLTDNIGETALSVLRLEYNTVE